MTPTAITETWVKPLTMNDRIMIELLTHKYEGVDAAFIKVEDESSVTLRIPKIRHWHSMEPLS